MTIVSLLTFISIYVYLFKPIPLPQRKFCYRWFDLSFLVWFGVNLMYEQDKIAALMLFVIFVVYGITTYLFGKDQE
jgi:hypothetical protein